MANGTAVHTDTRQKIINATLLVTARYGFDRATTGEISRTAGVSEGIIYHYFRSKRELYVNMIKERAANYRQALDKELAGAGSPKEKLDRLIDFHFEHFTGRKSMFHGVLDRTSDTPLINEQLIKIAMAPYCRMIAEIIKEGIKAGEFKEAESQPAAFSLLGMMQLPAIVMHFGHAGFSPRDAADNVKKIFFGGILK
ncbi:MAG: TetR/AcrR family transcriptional regulator [Candidatus Omnitrophica bacterium]|nr:TetR/AcrR family transcriptional regulator [Candidatus Omnitrophota bacterium]